MKSELQVLRETRQLVETGWTSGRNVRNLPGEERYCLVGAINKVTHVPLQATSCDCSSRFRRNGKVRDIVVRMLEDKTSFGRLESWNDVMGPVKVIEVLDELISELELKNMEIGTPEKEYTVEPAEPVPGIKESPAPTPEPRKEPVTPEREKVPA